MQPEVFPFSFKWSAMSSVAMDLCITYNSPLLILTDFNPIQA